MKQIFSEALALQKGDVISISGAGGKTGLLYTLARENYLGSGLYTTTTKMFDPRLDAHPFQKIYLDWNSSDPPPSTAGSCFAAGEILRSEVAGVKDKVRGLSNKLLENWNSMGSWPILIIEADGAAGKPLKFPSVNEPVIPGHTSHAVGCIGLEALGEQISESLVHHPELFRSSLPLGRNSEICPETLAALINKKDGLFKNCPEQVKRTVVLNKIDLLNSEYKIHDLFAYFTKECPSVRIIASNLKTGQLVHPD
jgi:probable selenium-dependent hydroxylase accessory protein YqeC